MLLPSCAKVLHSRDGVSTAREENPNDLPEPRTGPILVCDEPIHDFGTVYAGAELKHVFIIRNDGDETAWVKWWRMGTLCINCRFSLAPRQSTMLAVALNSKRIHGRFETPVTLTWISPSDDDTCRECRARHDSRRHLWLCGPFCLAEER